MSQNIGMTKRRVLVRLAGRHRVGGGGMGV